MASAEQSGETLRDFSSPATWGDVEQVRLSLETKIDTSIADVKTQMAEVETRLVSRIVGLETQVESRFGALETQVESRFGALERQGENRSSGLEARLSEFETGLERRLAQLEVRLTRLFLGAVAAGVAVLGVLVGILQAVD
ncbi:MAG: hypothetical protein OXH41_08055 [Chloroflexi bacterium]|nr:hypothetical protein [Chloroflexota bacterium]